MPALAVLLVFLAPALRAQPAPDRQPAPDHQPAATESPVVEYPRTFKERFQDYRAETFTPWALFTPSVTAGLSQWRNYPPEWQQGGEGFGKRLASGYGTTVIDNTIALGIASIDHEDLRYPRSNYPKSAILKRTAHAFSYTLVPKKEGGGRRFGFSRLIGAYGSGFIANTWYPSRHSDTSNALYLGSVNLGGDLAVNLLKEFIRPHFVFGSAHKDASDKKEAAAKPKDDAGKGN